MDPDLWIEALTYFALRDDDCQHEIGEVLNNIDRDNLLPPLPIIQILSQKVRHLLESTTHGTIGVKRDSPCATTLWLWLVPCTSRRRSWLW
jgi:hypothetical protein